MPDISDTVNKVEQEQQAKAGTRESALEKKAKRGILRKIVDFGFMGLTTGAAWAIAGPLNVLAVTGSYLLAYSYLHRKELKYEGLRKEVHFGNAMTALLYYSFYAWNYSLPANLLVNSAIFLAALPVWIGVFIPMRYMFYNYSPLKLLKDTVTLKILGLPKKIKEIYKQEYKKALKNLYIASPFIIGIRTFVPFKYQLVTTAITRFINRLAIGRGGKLGYQTSPYQKPA